MKKPKTPEQIEAEIKALQICKRYVPPTSFFGDNNHKNIDLQIEYLQGEIDTTAEDYYDEFSDSERDAITAAEEWKDYDGTSPSEDWGALKPK